MKFNCKSGFAKLGTLKYIGLTKDDKTSCGVLNEAISTDVPDLYIKQCLHDKVNKDGLQALFKDADAAKEFELAYNKTCLD